MNPLQQKREIPTFVRQQKDWTTIIASLATGAAFFALWFWLLPGWLEFRMRDDITHPSWRWIAIVLSVCGFAIAIRCVWDFGRTGRGTPAPIAPPERLVVVGMYRHVRNPMYVGFILGWMGLWIVFGRANHTAILAACAVLLGVDRFVAWYEEPTLRKKFGADYIEYCKYVRRWIPRATPWKPR